MAFLAPLALLTLAGFLHRQDDPPVFPQAKIEIKENNWIEYRPKLTKQGPSSETIKCSNPCNGKKHTLHTECDTSCDGACTEIHKYTFEPKWKCAPGGDIKANGQKFGLPDLTWTVVHGVSTTVKKELKGKVKKYDLGHWNKTPCSYSERRQGFETFKVQADYQFFRNDIGPDGRKILVKGPSGTWDYGTVAVPEGDLGEAQVDVRCRCSVVSDHYDDEEAGVFIEEKGTTALATSKQIEEKNITVECPSMTEGIVTCTNTGSEDCRISIGPGTILTCVGGSCQDEVVCEPVTFVCLAYSSLHVSLSTRPWLGDGSTKARAACINMHKPEPRAGVKYAFSMPSNGAVSQLAKKAAAENFRGSWDQVRIWIITDHASREDIAKILLPRPRAGLYLNSLYEVSLFTGTDLLSDPFKPCVDPAHIIGATASREATDWYVDLWARKDPKTLANWLNQHGPELTAECFGPNTGDSQAAHAADLFNALCASGVPALVDAAMNALTKAVPGDKRALVAKAHGLEGALAQLTGTDAKAAAKALDVAELYRDEGSKHLLLNVNEALGDSIRTRALKLNGEIAG